MGLRRQRGFTLLELLITLSVTTIGLIGLLSLHLSVARGNDGASRAAEAQEIGATELESLRAMRLGDLMTALTGSSIPTFPTPPRIRTVQGRGNMTYTITSTVIQLTSASASLMRIRVLTAWTEDGGASTNTALSHALALEVVRTIEESL